MLYSLSPSLTLYVTVNSEFQWGHRHEKETNPCLLIQEKTGNGPREGSGPVHSGFQITEDIRLRRQGALGHLVIQRWLQQGWCG